MCHRGARRCAQNCAGQAGSRAAPTLRHRIVLRCTIPPSSPPPPLTVYPTPCSNRIRSRSRSRSKSRSRSRSQSLPRSRRLFSRSGPHMSMRHRAMPHPTVAYHPPLPPAAPPRHHGAPIRSGACGGFHPRSLSLAPSLFLPPSLPPPLPLPTRPQGKADSDALSVSDAEGDALSASACSC